VLKLRDGLVELYKKVATSIPPDVEEAMKYAFASEDNAGAKQSLAGVLELIRKSRQASRPACIETGIPIFKVKVPRGLSHNEIKNTILEATAIATRKVPLGLSAVNVLTGENSGDNTGIGFPVIYLEEAVNDTLSVDLMLRAGDCENYGQTYQLPVEDLQAGRDLNGVRRCVVDCVRKAGGKGCPPYTVGVGIGATHDQVSVLAIHQLFRKIPDGSEYPAIAELEKEVLNEINKQGTGSVGTGRATSALGVKMGINHRHPESFLVHVSLVCWANRRGRLIW